MKKTVILLLLAAALALPAAAQAYTVYNHVAYEACIIDAGRPESCAFKVDPNGSFKAWDSAPRVVWFNYNTKPGTCYLSQNIVTVPRTGSAKLYAEKVEIYNADGKLIKEVGMVSRVCGQRPGK